MDYLEGQPIGDVNSITPDFTIGENSTHLCFPFPQHRVRRQYPQGRVHLVLLEFGMAARMVDSATDFHRIRPNKILYVIIPRDIKLLLAYGAGQASQIIITRHRDELGFGVILRCNCSRYCCGVLRPTGRTTRAIFFVRPRFDPFLEVDISIITANVVPYSILTNSSTYQLRLCPRLAVSARR